MKSLHISQGRLEYHTRWVLLVCDEGVVDFYQWLYTKKTGVKIHKSKFGSHISVVRGHEEGIEEGWWERNENGPEIQFSYSNEMRWSEPIEGVSYVWLDVQSDGLEKVRTDLGLCAKPPFDFHLTVGRRNH